MNHCISIASLAAAAFVAMSASAQTGQSAPAIAPSPTTAASPPATSLEEVRQQPIYKTSWDQFMALKAKAHAPMPGDWAGIWENVNDYGWEPGYPWKVRLPAFVPLKPEYRARYDKLFDNFAAGVDYDTMSDCIPVAYPRMLAQGMLEIAVTPEETWIMAEHPNEAHRVYTDGRPHVADEDAAPEWEGDSIGFWDGDTLIVHTNHVRAQPMSYQRDGPPSSDQLSTVEQWRKIDDDHIVLQVTVYDPVVLSAPWRAKPRLYARVKPPYVPRIDLYTCVPGDVRRDEKGGTVLLVPGDPGYINEDMLVDQAAKSIDKLSR